MESKRKIILESNSSVKQYKYIKYMRIKHTPFYLEFSDLICSQFLG